MYFKLFVILILSILSVKCAPITKEPENCDEKNEELMIVDERQNGTENYRVNIKDVVIMWAPGNSLLAAAGLLDLGNLDGEFEEFEFPTGLDSSNQKPTNQNHGLGTSTTQKSTENYMNYSTSTPSSNTDAEDLTRRPIMLKR